jgi:PAS domain S-box-containing protein
MVIVFLLVFLNFVSNYIIYRARSTEEERALAHVRTSALAVSRLVQASYPEAPGAGELESVRQVNGLRDLVIVPSRPLQTSDEAKRLWMRSVLRGLPPGQWSDLAEKLFKADYHELTRGRNTEYYYLYPVPAGAGHSLMILSIDRPELAYLDDSRNTQLIVQIVALLVVGIVYSLLSKYIFRPFRRLRSQAEAAGRTIDAATNDTEALVQEYEAIIEQLRAKESELLLLNARIQGRADSLEEFNRYLIDSSTSGVIVLDPAGVIVSVNDKAAGLLRLTEGECVGQSYSRLLHGCPALEQDVSQAVLHGAVGSYREYYDVHGEGADSVIGVTVSSIREAEGGTVGLLLLINDLSDQIALSRELEDKRRLAALGEMAGGLAHQLRNSLGAISGYGTLLKKKLDKEHLSGAHAEALLTESREAESLISRFLTFAKPFDLSFQPVSMEAVVEQAIRQFEVGAEVRFKTSFERIPDISGDALLLKQVVANLIDNAIKAYEGAAAEVTVSLLGDDGSARLRIEDHGSGIPEADLPRIFTPFFSSRPSGTGLGLSLAKRIVDLHGGRLTVSSEQGRGSVFELSLPLYSGASQPGSVRAGS